MKLNGILGKLFHTSFEKIKLTNISKLEILSRKHVPIVQTTGNNDKRIYNYTNTQLPQEVEEILRCGPKFSVPFASDELPIPRIITDVEFYISSLEVDDANKDILRSDFVNILTNHLHHVKGRTTIHDEIQKKFYITKNFLKSNDDIIVSRSDKGGSTVIMYREEYINKVKSMLSDTTTYKRLQKDPTSVFQKKANTLIDYLFNSSFISDFQKKNMKIHNSVPPKLYCLRKTHKQGLHLRPIVSGIDSPSSSIARLVHDVLSGVTTIFQHQINNSFEFVEFSKTVVLPEDYILVSLDVVSLFTNVTHSHTKNVIQKNWHTISAYTSLDKATFLTLIDFLFQSSYFVFDDDIYQQVEGTTMGGIASPALAALVMNDLVTTVTDQLPFTVPFFRFYVDDSITAIPKDKVNETLLLFNRYHEKIQFTVELENEGSLPFLDVCVHRTEQQKLTTNWYTKPTSSGVILNYLSTHSLGYKINAIHNILNRAVNLSAPVYHNQNLEKVKNILYNNNYPKHFVNRIISELLPKIKNKNNNIIQTTKKYYKIPYIPELSQKLKRTLKTDNKELVFYNMKTVGLLYSRIKDPNKKEQTSGLIYEIPCLDCDKVYIGQTKQYLNNRMKQHKYDLKDSKNREKTALCSHFFVENHRFDFPNVKILEKEKQYRKRNILEMIHINLSESVNFRSDTSHLSCLYNPILSRYKNLKEKR